MTDAQAGGIKGRATVDHILILKELANISINQSIKSGFVFILERVRGPPARQAARFVRPRSHKVR